MAAYLRLYVPAALSIASDFWRMSAVGAFAARLSTLDLAVRTINPSPGPSPSPNPKPKPKPKPNLTLSQGGAVCPPAYLPLITTMCVCSV